MIQRSWIVDCLKIDKISEKVIKFFTVAVTNWKVKLMAGGKPLAESKIQRNIIQGNAHRNGATVL